MQLRQVTSPQTVKAFLDLPSTIYKDHPNWIRPLDKDIEQVFDPTRNPNFKNGSCIRWILEDAQGEAIGRVAAFVNNKTKNATEYATGGMGFFECIENQAAAFVLFDACQNWLKEQGLEAMDGPINFGERDRWWGLLVDGFTEPNYGMFYHPPYYQQFFEAYGFQVYFKQYTYKRRVADPLGPKIMERAAHLEQDPHYSTRHPSKKNLPQLAKDFSEVYNKAWAGHSGTAEIPFEKALQLMKSMKPAIVEQLLNFAYYKDQPIGFFFMLPELNQIFKHLNGKFGPWAKIKFLYHFWRFNRGKDKKVFGLIFGVIPEYQGKGVEALMMKWAHQPLIDYGAPDIEMNWIGDFNPKMMLVTRSLGATIYKTHITYRKIFDPAKPFTRHPVIK